MSKKIEQNINGSNNITAGRDVYIKYSSQEPLRFYDEDFKIIILAFAKNLKSMTDHITDFIKPDIQNKNKINKLSDEYFEYIKENSLPYFSQIDDFLKDPINDEFLYKYQATVKELQHLVIIYRKKVNSFEELFEMIFRYILEQNLSELKEKRDLILLFIHYMYWNCDIGRKPNDNPA